MLILGVASVGVFLGKGRLKNLIQKILFFIVAAMPLIYTFLSANAYFFCIFKHCIRNFLFIHILGSVEIFSQTELYQYGYNFGFGLWVLFTY